MGSVRINSLLEEKIRRVAAQKGITRSELFRQALESYCQQETSQPQGSRYDDVIGIIDAPEDGSARYKEYFLERLTEKYGSKK